MLHRRLPRQGAGLFPPQKVLGASTPRILFGHLLPNTVAIIVTVVPFTVSRGWYLRAHRPRLPRVRPAAGIRDLGAPSERRPLQPLRAVARDLHLRRPRHGLLEFLITLRRRGRPRSLRSEKIHLLPLMRRHTTHITQFPRAARNGLLPPRRPGNRAEAGVRRLRSDLQPLHRKLAAQPAGKPPPRRKVARVDAELATAQGDAKTALETHAAALRLDQEKWKFRLGLGNYLKFGTPAEIPAGTGLAKRHGTARNRRSRRQKGRGFPPLHPQRSRQRSGPHRLEFQQLVPQARSTTTSIFR